MKLTLRKASAVQSVIMDKINSINLSTTVELNEFQSPEEIIKSAADALSINIDLKESLLGAYYEIRTALGIVNASCGVTQKLAALVEYEKKMQMYKNLVTTPAREDASVIIGKVSRLKTSDSASYAYRNTVTTGILLQSVINGFESLIYAYTKEKQKLNDEILELNIKNSIDLSDSTTELLTRNNII